MADRQLITNVDGLTSDKVKWAGMDANKITYVGDQGQLHLKWMQIYTIQNNKAYLLTFTAEPAQFDAMMGTVNKIVDSFKL